MRVKKLMSFSHKKETLICSCGKEFEAAPSLKRKYCSHLCFEKVQPNRKLDQCNLEQNLRKYYLTEKLSTLAIALKLNCDPKTVAYWLHKFGVPIRTLSESAQITRARHLWAGPEMRALLRVSK